MPSPLEVLVVLFLKMFRKVNNTSILRVVCFLELQAGFLIKLSNAIGEGTMSV